MAINDYINDLIINDDDDEVEKKRKGKAAPKSPNVVV